MPPAADPIRGVRHQVSKAILDVAACHASVGAAGQGDLDRAGDSLTLVQLWLGPPAGPAETGGPGPDGVPPDGVQQDGNGLVRRVRTGLSEALVLLAKAIDLAPARARPGLVEAGKLILTADLALSRLGPPEPSTDPVPPGPN